LVLDKIGFMSLARFILSAQDRLRLDDLRVIKNKLNSLKEKYRKKHANHPTASSKRQIKGTSTTKTSSTTKKDTDTSLVV